MRISAVLTTATSIVCCLACCCPTAGPGAARKTPVERLSRAEAVRLEPGDLVQGAKGVLWKKGTDEPWPWRVVRVGSTMDLLVESPVVPFKRVVLRNIEVKGAVDGEMIKVPDHWVKVDGTDKWDGGTYPVVWLMGKLD